MPKQINIGLQLEKDLIDLLNGTHLSSLKEHMQSILTNLFNFSGDPDPIFAASKLDNKGKPDIKISYNDESALISVKTGRSCEFHKGDIPWFVEFLRKNDISEETIKTILLFQYGDGTIDGTGIKRKGYTEIMKDLSERIKKANIELNYDPEFVNRFCDLIIFKGNNKDCLEAQYVYHGTIDFGYLATKQEVLRLIRRNRYSFYNNLHIGPFLMRPYARYVDFNERYPYKRHEIVFEWPNIISDFHFINKNKRY